MKITQINKNMKNVALEMVCFWSVSDLFLFPLLYKEVLIA